MKKEFGIKKDSNVTIYLGDRIVRKTSSGFPVSAKKSLLRILRKNFDVRIINEFRTSKTCALCFSGKLIFKKKEKFTLLFFN